MTVNYLQKNSFPNSLCVFSEFIFKTLFLKIKITILFIFFLILPLNLEAQKGFRFLNKTKTKVRIDFILINNLIVIPLKINNRELVFILDTGSNKTILFNISDNDTIGLKILKK